MQCCAAIGRPAAEVRNPQAAGVQGAHAERDGSPPPLCMHPRLAPVPVGARGGPARVSLCVCDGAAVYALGHPARPKSFWDRPCTCAWQYPQMALPGLGTAPKAARRRR